MLCDLHVHSTFSQDSEATMEEYCQAALRQGVKTICFTDHLEGNPVDPGYGLFDFRGYFDELQRLRERYQDELTLLAGVEISEPHLYPGLLEQCRAYPFDMLLGSVHFWVGDIFPSQMKQQGINAQQSFQLYWAEVEKAVSNGGFDVFAHLDYPKRFYHRLYYEPEQIQHIFSLMKKNNIGLEVNCGGFRRQFSEANPGDDLLSLYTDCAGDKATLGSDAHRVSTFAYGIDKGRALLAEHSIQEVYYKNHQPVLVGE